MEWFEPEGTLKVISFHPLPCSLQQLDQIVPSPDLPGLEHSQGCGFAGQPVPGPQKNEPKLLITPSLGAL